jgi:uncharacterized protein
MERRIVEFTELLRNNGLRVSISEHIDAFRALAVAGLDDRETLKNTLRTTMVKRAIDLPVFDELFDLHFSGLGQVIETGAEGLAGALDLDAEGLADLITELEGVLEELDLDLSVLARALLANDAGRLEALLRSALADAQVGKMQGAFQEGKYSHATAQQLGLGALAEELDNLKARLAEAAIPSALAEKLRRLIERRLQDLSAMIKRAVRLELEKRDPSVRDRTRLANLAEKSFYYLSEEEMRRMKEAVAKLAQRLKNIVAIRRRRAKRGKFDVSATLRKNLQYGAVPFRIQFDRRVRDKPQVLVLCDVSDSVRNVSRFMLQFVYSLQDLYSRVRSFIFVSELGEITRLFEEKEVNEAIEEALTGNVVNVFAHSDFGRVFQAFRRDYLGAVNRRTTVIILGDARNNYNAPHEWVLRDVRERAKRVIWLNPESRLTWGFGDSEMDRYVPHCDLVEECRNLNQLYRVVDRLMA